MKLPDPHVQQKIKNYIHAAQALLIFLGWVLTIAVFTKPGTTDGRSKYYFVLVGIIISCRLGHEAKEYIIVLFLRTTPDLPDGHSNFRTNQKIRESLRVCNS